MARLFIGPREQAFMSDITKELLKDIVGQKIYYYSISADRTKTHPVYEEAVEKVFDPPVEVDALVASPEYGTTVNDFTVDQTYKVEAYVQWKDAVDKGLDPSMGDFFTYGDITYEITSVNFMKPVYGQIEHKDGIKLTGVKAREGLLKVRPHGPTDVSFSDPDAVQETFVQQRGERENRLGPTNDRRELYENGTLDRPLSGPREVAPRGAGPGGKKPAFYDEG